MEDLYFVVQIKPWGPDDEPNPQAPGHKLYVNGVPYDSEDDFIKEVKSSVIQDIVAMNDGNVSWDTACVQITREEHDLMVSIFQSMFRKQIQVHGRND